MMDLPSSRPRPGSSPIPTMTFAHGSGRRTRSTLRLERHSSCSSSKEVRMMSQLPTGECQDERRVSDLSDRGAKSVRSLNPQQDVPTPLKGEDVRMASNIQAADSQ